MEHDQARRKENQTMTFFEETALVSLQMKLCSRLKKENTNKGGSDFKMEMTHQSNTKRKNGPYLGWDKAMKIAHGKKGSDGVRSSGGLVYHIKRPKQKINFLCERDVKDSHKVYLDLAAATLKGCSSEITPFPMGVGRKGSLHLSTNS